MAFFHETFSVDDNLAALTNSPNNGYLFGQGDLQAVPNVSTNLAQAIEDIGPTGTPDASSYLEGIIEHFSGLSHYLSEQTIGELSSFLGDGDQLTGPAGVLTTDAAHQTDKLLNAVSDLSAESYSNAYGYGLVNAADAVAKTLGQTTPLPSVDNLGETGWGLDMVNAPEVWAQGYTGENVVVAVIDSGVDINHSDLQNNIWVNANEIPNNGIDDDDNGYVDDINGWNFGSDQNNNNVLPGTNDPSQGHGTHVAGTIAAANDGVGITGVAYEASIMAIRMGDLVGGKFVNPGSLADAIRYAVDNGADVINMSLGWSDSIELQNAVAYAASKDVITVSAAGNGDATGNGLALLGSPAQYATQYGISVGAVDINQDLARFSNRPGENSAIQHVVTPGVGIYSTRPNNTYGFSSGTSMAAPHVAGVVALMLDANPELNHGEAREILTGSSISLV
ncbi:MAG: S8 family serine peptidase [Cyanobacteria bacterium P01_H01_bin.21]